MRIRILLALVLSLTVLHCGSMSSEESAESGIITPAIDQQSPPNVQESFVPPLAPAVLDDGHPDVAPTPPTLVVAGIHEGAVGIPFRITSKFWNAETESLENTPSPLIEKIQQAFKLWESVPGTNLTFTYAGLTEVGGATVADLPDDGSIVVVVDGNTLGMTCSNGVSGRGGFVGTIPDNYRKGFVVLNTKAGLHALQFSTLVHEIGHAIGLHHSASNASIMFCGTKGWSAYEFLAFSEQDRADLLARWNPGLIYRIAGQVQTSLSGQWPLVYAVDVENGRTYSALSSSGGNFVINLLKPGNYRLFAKAYESSAFRDIVAVSPSWYVHPMDSSNDPAQGTVITVSDVAPIVQDIIFPFIEVAPPFNFFWAGPISFSYADPEQIANSVPSFARPGQTIQLMRYFNTGLIASMEAFGATPDFEVINFNPASTYVTIYVHPDATEGHRMLVARGASGTTQFGDLGFHILKNALPGFTPQQPAAQLGGGTDFSAMDPLYWQ